MQGRHRASDAIRAVNAVLTQIDQIKRYPLHTHTPSLTSLSFFQLRMCLALGVTLFFYVYSVCYLSLFTS